MTRQLVIGPDRINDDSECYVIAEIGHNHQGDINKAKEMFLAAKECGAKAVKLQKRDNRSLFTKELYNKPYDNENSFGATYGEHREFLEFGLDQYKELKRYAQEIGITFFATAFDIPSADFLENLDMPAFKIASGDLTNIPLLKYVAGFQKPMIVSTGGAVMEDVQRAYDAIMPVNPRLCLMQCTAGYPPAYEELNLKVITTFRNHFPDIVVGFSGHDSGIAMSLAAFMLGARVVEKHFTLNRAMKGTDHAFSLERPGLQKMIRDLKRARMAMGDGIKKQYPSEAAPLTKMGKQLVAAKNLDKGHRLTREDIAIKSPGGNIPPYELDKMIGKILTVGVAEDAPFRWDILK
jgi:sialic acid synthase